MPPVSFDHAAWDRSFRAATGRRPDRSAIRRLRIKVIEHTLEILRSTGREIQLSAGLALSGEKCERPGDDCWVDRIPPALQSDMGERFNLSALRRLPDPPKLPNGGTTKIAVWPGDCLEVCARLFSGAEWNPVVLNMASHRSPGGGYMHGAGAQEENLFRRSNYSEVLPRRYYPLGELDVVYNPRVHVFRGAESRGYPLVPVTTLSFIACAAFSHPPLVEDGASGELLLDPDFTAKTAEKVRSILEAAAARGHDALILSALGCGAFRNPPRHIARIFRDVLAETRYVNVFRTVCFAIFDDHNAGKTDGVSNLAAFQGVFGTSG